MARATKLKVFCMPAGFHDAIVAAPSRAAALRAWGTTTDLFAAGRASVVEDEELKAEALARPGQVIKRPRGDDTAMLGAEPAQPFEPRPASRPKSGPKPEAQPPDRSELDAAERELASAERDLSARLNEIAIERGELDRRETEARSSGEARIRELTRARSRAEATYLRALQRASGSR